MLRQENNICKRKKVLYFPMKEMDVGDGSWWNISQNLWETFQKIKKKLKVTNTRYI